MKRLALTLIVLSACGTKVVQLTPPQDASAGATCSRFTREDGVTCRLCFSDAGVVLSTECPTTPNATADANAMTMPPAPAATACKVTSYPDTRCLVCSTPNDTANTACLKCDAPTPSSAGGTCRVCLWSDDPMRRCLQCFTADGSKQEDGCDALRKEMLVYDEKDAGP